MKAKISEIFKSIQGEGKYCGSPQVFVRFQGCNLRCGWCDTPKAQGNSKGKGKEMDVDEVYSQISQQWNYDCHSVSLTGGEPLLQKDFLKELLPSLKKTCMRTYLETNGTLHKELKEIIGDVDIVSMDIKLPSSTGGRPFWTEHEKFLKIARDKDVFVKAVISLRTTQEDVASSVELVKRIAPDILFVLQPNAGDLSAKVMEKCMEFQKYCLKDISNVRIIPQMHKIMGIK